MRPSIWRSRVPRFGLVGLGLWLVMVAVTAAVFNPWPGWLAAANSGTISLVLVGVPLWFILRLIPPNIRALVGGWRERRRGGRFECMKCGYPLKGVPRAGPCPECGEPLGWIR